MSTAFRSIGLFDVVSNTPASPSGRGGGSEAGADRFSGKAVNPDQLVASVVARNQFERAFRYTEFFREEFQERLVGLPLDRRCGQPDANHPVGYSRNFLLRRPGLDANRQDKGRRRRGRRRGTTAHGIRWAKSLSDATRNDCRK